MCSCCRYKWRTYVFTTTATNNKPSISRAKLLNKRKLRLPEHLRTWTPHSLSSRTQTLRLLKWKKKTSAKRLMSFSRPWSYCREQLTRKKTSPSSKLNSRRSKDPCKSRASRFKLDHLAQLMSRRLPITPLNRDQEALQRGWQSRPHRSHLRTDSQLTHRQSIRPVQLSQAWSMAVSHQSFLKRSIPPRREMIPRAPQASVIFLETKSRAKNF